MSYLYLCNLEVAIGRNSYDYAMVNALRWEACMIDGPYSFNGEDWSL